MYERVLCFNNVRYYYYCRVAESDRSRARNKRDDVRGKRAWEVAPIHCLWRAAVVCVAYIRTPTTLALSTIVKLKTRECRVFARAKRLQTMIIILLLSFVFRRREGGSASHRTPPRLGPGATAAVVFIVGYFFFKFFYSSGGDYCSENTPAFDWPVCICVEEWLRLEKIRPPTRLRR